MKNSKVRDDNFVAIQGWMITKLGLKGNTLIVYAIIYGFSQDGQNHFTGSLQYLADWTSTTKPCVYKILRSLMDKGFIRKKDKIINNVKFCEYYVTPLRKLKGVNSSERGIKPELTGVLTPVNGGVNSSERGIKPELTNNIDNNINNNIDNNIAEVVEPTKQQTNDDDGLTSVINFYQSNFGMLSSYLYDDIRQTFDDWQQRSKEPDRIMIKAMQIALEKNVRNWRFVAKVLLTWENRHPKTLADVEALEKEHGRRANKKALSAEEERRKKEFNETYGYFEEESSQTPQPVTSETFKPKLTVSGDIDEDELQF